MRVLVRLFVLSLLVWGACDLAPRVTTDPARERWEAIAPQGKERLAGLKNRQVVVGGRVAALTVPPGIEDPALTRTITELQTKLGELAASIAMYEQTIAQVSGEIEAALAKHDKIAARKAVDMAGPRLDQAYAAAGVPFDTLEARLPEAEVATSRYLAVVAGEEQRLMRIASEGGDMDLRVKWNGAALDVNDPGTRATLDRLVKLAGSCDALKLRVDSSVVAQYLVGAGVPADRFAPVTNPATPNAATVKVTVTSPCLPPAPAQPGNAAANPAMPPPPTAVVERGQAPARPN